MKRKTQSSWKKPVGIMWIILLVLMVIATSVYFLNKRSAAPLVEVNPDTEIDSEEDERTDGLETVEDEKETKPIAELKANALYSTNVVDGTNHAVAYLFPIDGVETTLSSNFFEGKEGDRLYAGKVAIYLVEENGDTGVLQGQFEVEDALNLEREPFQLYSFNEQSLVGAFSSQTEHNNVLALWHYSNGEMKEVLFDKNKTVAISTKTLKFIDEDYMQAYLYVKSEETGWHFTTWKWDSSTSMFTEYDSTRHTDAEEYGWTLGEMVANNWEEMDYDYVSFPHLTLPDDLKALIEKGMLLDNNVYIGKPIDEMLNEYPDHTGDDYFNGGYYYMYPNGMTIFFDEAIGEINSISLNGQNFLNDLTSVQKMLGTPTEEGYDEMEDIDYQLYKIGPYDVYVYVTHTGEFSHIWLRGD
ncbi:hypothetical protein ACXYMX_15910 [Sporosarcina sp. CAU 1771]